MKRKALKTTDVAKKEVGVTFVEASPRALLARSALDATRDVAEWVGCLGKNLKRLLRWGSRAAVPQSR